MQTHTSLLSLGEVPGERALLWCGRKVLVVLVVLSVAILMVGTGPLPPDHSPPLLPPSACNEWSNKESYF